MCYDMSVVLGFCCRNRYFFYCGLVYLLSCCGFVWLQREELCWDDLPHHQLSPRCLFVFLNTPLETPFSSLLSPASLLLLLLTFTFYLFLVGVVGFVVVFLGFCQLQRFASCAPVYDLLRAALYAPFLHSFPAALYTPVCLCDSGLFSFLIFNF